MKRKQLKSLNPSFTNQTLTSKQKILNPICHAYRWVTWSSFPTTQRTMRSVPLPQWIGIPSRWSVPSWWEEEGCLACQNWCWEQWLGAFRIDLDMWEQINSLVLRCEKGHLSKNASTFLTSHFTLSFPCLFACGFLLFFWLLCVKTSTIVWALGWWMVDGMVIGLDGFVNSSCVLYMISWQNWQT